MSINAKKILFGILLALSLPALYLISFNLEFHKNDLRTVEGRLSKDPKFHSGSGKSPNPYLTIHLKGVNHHFCTDDFAYGVLKKDKLKSQLKKGDKIQIRTKKDSVTNLGDAINRDMGVYSIMELKTKEKTFISLEAYNNYRKKDFKFSYLFWFLLLLWYIDYFWINLATSK
jgi:hypothetical protein